MAVTCLVVGFLLLMVPVVVLVASPGFGYCASTLNAAWICRTPSGEGGASNAQGGGISLESRCFSQRALNSRQSANADSTLQMRPLPMK